MAACFAAKGHDVIGVDINSEFVDAVNAGKPPVFEPDLDRMIEKGGTRLTATTDAKRAISETEVTFVIVPTPSKPDGHFSTQYVLKAARPIAEAIKNKSTYHTVVLTSTVMPGDTLRDLVPELEEISGKKCSKDFGVCYSPEFISLGSVIRDYLYPDFVLIGESDERTGDILENFYRTIVENSAPVQRMSYVNAELTKLALNAFVTTKISYANMLAELCEKLEGGHVDAVTNALGEDTRIGRKYLKGSVGYGGPCFPRDSVALASLCRMFGLEAVIPEATEQVNARQVERLTELAIDLVPRDGRVGILGLAYKPDTNVVERAQGTELAMALTEAGIQVAVYDPNAMDNARKILKESVLYTESADRCAQVSDVVFITNPCSEYAELELESLSRSEGKTTIVDCWRLLDSEHATNMCNYIALGTDDVLKAETVQSRKTISHNAWIENRAA